MVFHGIWPKTTQFVLAAGVFVMEQTYNIADKRLTQKPTFLVFQQDETCMNLNISNRAQRINSTIQDILLIIKNELKNWMTNNKRNIISNTLTDQAKYDLNVHWKSWDT